MKGALKTPVDADADARAAELSELSELSELVTHLLNTAEAQRAALARELHDELGGMMTAAKMDMAWLSAHIGASLDPASEEKFRSVVQMLNQAMALKRRVVESLRPSLLDHFGLTIALRSHLAEQCGRAGLEYLATLPEGELLLAPATQLALFRIVEELLAKVLERRTAKHFELVIELTGDAYSMLVSDDGGGADEALRRALVGMRHRIYGAGGTLVLESVAGRGSRIKVSVPRSPARSE